jgi:hypothetical protein
LNILTNIEVSILKAENLILKNIAANPQPQKMQQSDTLESNTNLYDFMGIEDR